MIRSPSQDYGPKQAEIFASFLPVLYHQVELAVNAMK
jgi:hypothetical protein